MDPLSDIVTKPFRHLLATANVSIVSIGQIAAQQCQRQTMAAELGAGASQLRLISIYAQRSEQFRASIAGQMFQVTTKR